jgi:hypothetical protein
MIRTQGICSCGVCAPISSAEIGTSCAESGVKSRLQNTPVVFDCPIADDRSGPLKRRAHRPHRGGKALYVRVRRRVDAEGFEIGPWRLDARDLRIWKAVGEIDCGVRAVRPAIQNFPGWRDRRGIVAVYIWLRDAWGRPQSSGESPRPLETECRTPRLCWRWRSARSSPAGRRRHGSLDSQDFGFALFNPLGAWERLTLGSLSIPAAVVPDACVLTVVTLLHVPPSAAVRHC